MAPVPMGNRKQRRRHASRQAPWRHQLRLTGGVALPLITFLVISAIYLAVNAKVANAGRAVLSLERELAALERENAELVTRLAEETNPKRMVARAMAMGFAPAAPDQVEYLVVDGYTGEPEFSAPLPSATEPEGEGLLSPAYTETLGDWLTRLLGGMETIP